MAARKRLPGSACPVLEGLPAAMFVGHVPAAIANFIPFEVLHVLCMHICFRMLSRMRRWSLVPMFRMKMIIHMSAEIIPAVEPRSGPDKHAAVEPFRSIVSG